MILESLLNIIMGLLQVCFSWINLPPFPEELTSSISSFLDIIFGNLSLLGFFIRPITLTISIPILIILINFEPVYKFTMWILRKIPFLRNTVAY